MTGPRRVRNVSHAALYVSETAPGVSNTSLPVSDLEVAVERVSRLVLHAQALAERSTGLDVGTPDERADRQERVSRLRAAVTAGQRAIQDAVWGATDRRSSPDRRRGIRTG